MKTITSLALVALGFSIPASASASVNKTWVSGSGVDSGTCPITAPCAHFQYAVDQTASGGEVDVKDAGGYGTVVINKAISIVADGVLASISVPASGTGITVSAGNGLVILKGLTIDGHLLGGTGVTASSSVVISKSNLRNLRIAIVTSGPMVVDDSEVTGNEFGIKISGTQGLNFINNNRFNFNDVGISASGVTVYSFGDNKFSSHGTEVIGDLTPMGQR